MQDICKTYARHDLSRYIKSTNKTEQLMESKEDTSLCSSLPSNTMLGTQLLEDVEALLI